MKKKKAKAIMQYTIMRWNKLDATYKLKCPLKRLYRILKDKYYEEGCSIKRLVQTTL